MNRSFIIALFILVIAFDRVESLTCNEIRSIFFEDGCCTGESSPTCLREIPSCASTTGGKVCFDGTDVVVKGLLSSFDFTSTTQIVFKKHLIPDTNNVYDIGTAEYKVRDIYEQE